MASLYGQPRAVTYDRSRYRTPLIERWGYNCLLRGNDSLRSSLSASAQHDLYPPVKMGWTVDDGWAMLYTA